jgi:hypothetical protein
MTDVFGLWLESLDIEKVKLESFYSAAHREMLREHEARKRAVVEIAQAIKQTRRKRRPRTDYVFTDRQIEIAQQALGL